MLLEEEEQIENKKQKKAHVGLKVVTLASLQSSPNYVIRMFIKKMVKQNKEQNNRQTYPTSHLGEASCLFPSGGISWRKWAFPPLSPTGPCDT